MRDSTSEINKENFFPSSSTLTPPPAFYLFLNLVAILVLSFLWHLPPPRPDSRLVGRMPGWLGDLLSSRAIADWKERGYRSVYCTVHVRDVPEGPDCLLCSARSLYSPSPTIPFPSSPPTASVGTSREERLPRVTQFSRLLHRRWPLWRRRAIDQRNGGWVGRVGWRRMRRHAPC